MTTKVFTFGCRISDESRDTVEREIERGRRYYNQMIAAYNPHPRQRSSDIRRRFPAAESGCYTGTYHAVCAAFDQAISGKRVGKWPGDPYSFRKRGENVGAMVGVHIQPSATWGSIRGGSRSIVGSDHYNDSGKYFSMWLKVSKESEPIEVSVAMGNKCRGIRRAIPDDALVSHVMICRIGDFGTKGKYVLRVTAKNEDVAPLESPERVGVDVGFSLQGDGSILVAVDSDGNELRVPSYAVRMAMRVTELQSERDELANAERARLSGLGTTCQSKSAAGTADWIERNGIVGCGEFLAKEMALRSTQDHVRRRYQDIRKDAYRKAANKWAGAFILKPTLRAVADDGQEKPEGWVRTVACVSELHVLLKQRGAIEVSRERRSDSCAPDVLSAREIKTLGEAGTVLEGTARKAVRKFRKSKRAA